MPIPKKGESLKDYMKYCPSVVLNEGTTKDPKQAVAICYSLYKEHKKKQTKANINKLFNNTVENLKDNKE